MDSKALEGGNGGGGEGFFGGLDLGVGKFGGTGPEEEDLRSLVDVESGPDIEGVVAEAGGGRELAGGLGGGLEGGVGAGVAKAEIDVGEGVIGG